MLYKFSGAGNDFVILDGRQADVGAYRRPERISALCREHHTDGLMILTASAGQTDFVMEFYNPDGSGGMMCGNGGRCIVAFADFLGLKPAAEDGTWLFQAPDGLHTATILSGPTPVMPVPKPGPKPGPKPVIPGPTPVMPGPDRASQKWTVRLKMIDVNGIEPIMGGYFLNTGTRHYVKFVEDVDAIDIEKEAKPIRWDPAFQPEGTNVNFVQPTAEGLKVRTFEKGVEGETLACGTGLTASAIAAGFAGIPDQVGDDSVGQVGDDPSRNVGDDSVGQVGDDSVGQVGEDPVRHARPRPGISSYRLQCRRGDWLQVEYETVDNQYRNVYLTGPAEII